jgi:hypothetical protein
VSEEESFSSLRPTFRACASRWPIRRAPIPACCSSGSTNSERSLSAPSDGADDTAAFLADEHVAFGHAPTDLGRREVGHDQLDGLRWIVPAVGYPHRVLHQRTDRGRVIGRGGADHQIVHDPP